MKRSCETCLRGPEPYYAQPACGTCGDDLTNHIPQPLEQEPVNIELAETRIDIIGSNGNDGLHYDQAEKAETDPDPVNHPEHYTSHPSGVECIQITEHMGFCLGNAIKYIWRADEKGADIEDLQKAAWYIQREITKRTQDQHHA